MADVHDKAIRSYNMSRIRAKDTKPEMLVRKYLHARGLRYKLHDKNLPGKPDLVFPKYKTVLFVNGCFWHGHKDCKYFVMPKTRRRWWQKKIEETKKRDDEEKARLEHKGWRVLTVWECELKQKSEETLKELVETIEL